MNRLLVKDLHLAAALKNNPDIVDVLQNQIIDGIAAAKAELKGSVTEAMDTLGEIETALNSEIADRTAAVNAEQQAREAGDAALDSRLTTVEGQVNGKIGNLSSLHTDEKGSLVGAINEVQDEVEAEAARASAAETTITNRVAAEETRAAAAESALQNAVDAEIAARQQAVADEAAAALPLLPLKKMRALLPWPLFALITTPSVSRSSLVPLLLPTLFSTT